jgi:hypothetical protein
MVSPMAPPQVRARESASSGPAGIYSSTIRRGVGAACESASEMFF